MVTFLRLVWLAAKASADSLMVSLVKAVGITDVLLARLMSDLKRCAPSLSFLLMSVCHWSPTQNCLPTKRARTHTHTPCCLLSCHLVCRGVKTGCNPDLKLCVFFLFVLFFPSYKLVCSVLRDSVSHHTASVSHHTSCVGVCDFVFLLFFCSLTVRTNMRYLTNVVFNVTVLLKLKYDSLITSQTFH